MTRCGSFRLVHRNEEPLFDHPVRLREKGGWKIEANCFRGFQANDQFKSARPLDRQVARTRTPQNFVGRSDRILHKLSIYGSATQRGWDGAARSVSNQNRRSWAGLCPRQTASRPTSPSGQKKTSAVGPLVSLRRSRRAQPV